MHGRGLVDYDSDFSCGGGWYTASHESNDGASEM
jgi:hypothetical protein